MFWKVDLFLSSGELVGRHLLTYVHWKELIAITGSMKLSNPEAISSSFIF
jgi:hypothetical protein